MIDYDEADLLQFLGMLLSVNVELDRRTLTIREILDLKIGSVLALRRPAGENLDVRIGGVRIGSGEAVIVDNMLAIRLTGLDPAP